MKKAIPVVTMALIMAIFSLQALALDQANPSGTTTLTTTVGATYTIAIPADTTITAGTLSTSIGAVKATALNLEAGKKVTVSAEADASLAKGEDSIAFTLNSDGNPFTSIDIDDVNDEAELTVDITEAAWNAAAAGTYTGTIDFTIAYVPAD